MNLKHIVPMLCIAFAAPAIAQTYTSDQGLPGTKGAWPVRLSGGSSGTNPSSSANAKIPAATTTVVAANATPCTAPTGASCTIIYASTSWIQWTNITITLSNTDGANALTNVIVEWSADGTRWEAWDTTTLAGLAAGTTKSIAISGNSRRFLRIEARAAATVTSAVVNVQGNDGG